MFFTAHKAAKLRVVHGEEVKKRDERVLTSRPCWARRQTGFWVVPIDEFRRLTGFTPGTVPNAVVNRVFDGEEPAPCCLASICA